MGSLGWESGALLGHGSVKPYGKGDVLSEYGKIMELDTKKVSRVISMFLLTAWVNFHIFKESPCMALVSRTCVK